MHRKRRIKILATLGPASSSKEKITELFNAGADMFRINMSHSSHELLNDLVATLRSVEKDVGRPIGILADLQGPKLRLSEFANDKIEVDAGDQITLDLDETPGTQKRIHVPHPEIIEALKPGHRILIDDGKVTLKVIKASDSEALTEVVSGTKLSSRKGVSLPDSDLGVSSLTEKDYADLDAALAAEVD